MQNNIPENLVWKAQNHIQHRHSTGWYVGFTIVSLGLLGFAYYSRSLTAAITFVLIIVVLLILSIQPSQEITYKITKTGIIVGNVVYPFKVIKKFWVLYNPPEVKTLNFETTAYLNNRVIVQLGKQDPIQVKLLLGNYLIEDIDMEESMSEGLARKLKI
ncbi:MAG: hypothetical protein KW804_01835 [Candidatus Doudnabacteria bacterium]|nr:hypothetical protein [Candidatus Doudnabacteria bacterium]